jgi:Flp pilus assembly protein TadG
LVLQKSALNAKPLRGESGATTVYFLLFTLALFGLLAMAVDVGRFYTIQAELQTAADAAALAAGTKLVGTTLSTDQANTQWNASFDTTTGNDNRFNLRLNQFQSSANLQSQVAVNYFTTLTEATANTGGGETGGIDWGSGIYPKYAKVQISAQSPTLFAPFLNLTPGLLPTITVSSIGGLSGPLCSVSGIDDLAVVDPSAGSDSDNFSLVPGDYYTLSQSSTQAALNSTDSTVQYVILDHYPNGVQDSSLLDDLLFELAAGGISNSPPSVPPSSTITIGDVEVDYGSTNSVATTVLLGTTTAAGRDILCGLNLRFGIDPSTYDACSPTTATSADFEGLVSLFPAAADTDTGIIASGAGTPPQQDFAADYCSEGACNFRRVLTVPVIDATGTLNVQNFRQFLLEPSPVSGTDTSGVGIDPTVANGSFRAQYIGALVPVPSGTSVGCSSLSNSTIGVGKVVLH